MYYSCLESVASMHGDRTQKYGNILSAGSRCSRGKRRYLLLQDINRQTSGWHVLPPPPPLMIGPAQVASVPRIGNGRRLDVKLHEHQPYDDAGCAANTHLILVDKSHLLRQSYSIRPP